MRPPSDRQQQILRAIRVWIAEHGEGPSVREIGRAVGLSSSSSVAYQLSRLEERGLISRTGRRWRSVRLG
ncbi:LexA family protein [Streptomyces sp. AK02-01A]|uniref:LexA family protein n=1 Tax=Streptomyces sp. AK02-01A TaxID=3028648 RepID=UPI0029B4DCA1|nr:MarR family transcriptional regulator [Streptomyces sp. AK02-01A]MDX3855609.1 MarR family transcriptional regulator [Streptomyces sp. AK02-01A]